jgi:hypothetical protein
MILGFASALNYLDYFLIIYRDRSHQFPDGTDKYFPCIIAGYRVAKSPFWLSSKIFW